MASDYADRWEVPDPAASHRLSELHPRTPWGARNGIPESARYEWRPGENERDAEVAARVAGAKARTLAARDRGTQWWQEHQQPSKAQTW